MLNTISLSPFLYLIAKDTVFIAMQTTPYPRPHGQYAHLSKAIYLLYISILSRLYSLFSILHTSPLRRTKYVT